MKPARRPEVAGSSASPFRGHGRCDRGREVHATPAAQAGVDFLKALDQIAHVLPGGGASGGVAKVGAAAERPALVDLAASVFQEGAGTVWRVGHRGAPGGPPGEGRHQGLSLGKERRATGEKEPAAITPAGTGALDRALCPFAVNGTDRGGGGFEIGAGFHGRSGFLTRRQAGAGARMAAMNWTNRMIAGCGGRGILASVPRHHGNKMKPTKPDRRTEIRGFAGMSAPV
jgi:hypothetical protein